MTCTHGRLDLARPCKKKVTGTTLRFLPSYPEQLTGDFPCRANRARGSWSKQQVIGMMFGFLPNDFSPPLRPGPALQKKVTGTTLRFLPSYPERISGAASGRRVRDLGQNNKSLA